MFEQIIKCRWDILIDEIYEQIVKYLCPKLIMQKEKI